MESVAIVTTPQCNDPHRALRALLLGCDYASVRRRLIEERLMRRAAGLYDFTDTGAAIWRVEHRVKEGYLNLP
jgi:hypothetical protein